MALFNKKAEQQQLILQEQLPALILNLEFPKKMRWGDVDITYARPLHWIVSLFGQEVVPFRVGPILAGRTTYGHRQLAPQAYRIKKSARLSPKPSATIM